VIVTKTVQPNSVRPAGLRAEWVEVDGVELLLLSHDAEPSVSPVAGEGLFGLSPAELAVTRQILLGKSNAEIASARGTSPRTVAKQVERIFARLGVSSRAELCALEARHRGRAETP
jgi:DNA-binding CsgD family transcriptional regulator